MPDVHRHVPIGSAHHPDQLALRIRRDLQVQAAHHTAISRSRVICPHEGTRHRPPLKNKRRSFQRSEKNPLVEKAGRRDHQDIWNAGRLDNHACSPSANSISTRPNSVLPSWRACERSRYLRQYIPCEMRLPPDSRPATRPVRDWMVCAEKSSPAAAQACGIEPSAAAQPVPASAPAPPAFFGAGLGLRWVV